MPFSEILGQEKATAYLKTLVQKDRVPGAFLFYGPEGVGKAKTALAFAKALNCLDPQARTQGDACGVCAACKAINKTSNTAWTSCRAVAVMRDKPALTAAGPCGLWLNNSTSTLIPSAK